MTNVKVPFNGKTVDAEEMEFEVETTPIGVYKVEDGTRIEVRHIVSAIYRVSGEKAPDGSCIYLIMGTSEMLKKVQGEGSAQ